MHKRKQDVMHEQQQHQTQLKDEESVICLSFNFTAGTASRAALTQAKVEQLVWKDFAKKSLHAVMQDVQMSRGQVLTVTRTLLWRYMTYRDAALEQSQSSLSPVLAASLRAKWDETQKLYAM